MKKVELLSPAGDWPSLVAAVEAGANAVYFGLKEFSMRASAKNFETSELKKVVDYCHENKVKAYLTLNTIVYDNEIEKVKKIVKEAKKAKVDAVMCWDFSVIEALKKEKIPFFISTQASVSNAESAKFYKKIGAKRVVLARELNIDQVRDIVEKSGIEVECFCHGAMCVAVSGRCFTSQFLYGESANRGGCLQPCRRQYKVKDAETDDELILENNCVMSPKDLCTLPFIDKLINSGIISFKIEGRNRSPEYVKTVTEAYREAIDSVYLKKFDKKLADKLMKRVKSVYNRKFSSGFFLGKPTEDDWTDVYGSNATATKKYVGYVRNFYKKVNAAEIRIEAGEVKKGDTIMIIGNKTGVFEQKIGSMQQNHKDISTAKKGKSVAIQVKKEARPNDKVFIIKKP
jgi:putative protease